MNSTFLSSAIYWMNYEALKNKFSYLGFSASFFSGLFSGAVSQFLSVFLPEKETCSAESAR